MLVVGGGGGTDMLAFCLATALNLSSPGGTQLPLLYACRRWGGAGQCSGAHGASFGVPNDNSFSAGWAGSPHHSLVCRGMRTHVRGVTLVPLDPNVAGSPGLLQGNTKLRQLLARPDT